MAIAKEQNRNLLKKKSKLHKLKPMKVNNIKTNKHFCNKMLRATASTLRTKPVKSKMSLKCKELGRPVSTTVFSPHQKCFPG